MAADGNSPRAAAQRLQATTNRMRDLSPAYRALATNFARQTADAFSRERSPHGEQWDRLAPSTVARRAAKLKGANRRNKKTGRLTKGARAKRADAIARYSAGGGGIFKPLQDNGRLRQTLKYIPRPDGVEVSGVWYLKFHVTGSLKVRNRPPKRNPLVIQQRPSGDGYALIPSAHSLWLRTITTYINTGAVTA